MKLDPISPQQIVEDTPAYAQRERTSTERLLDKIKPRSAAMRTTVLVVFAVFFSLLMSLWFFWRTLYIPEVKQHARYLAVELDLLKDNHTQVYYNNLEVDLSGWLESRVGLERVTDPDEFPRVREKIVAEWFTREIEEELAKQLGVDDVTVYFQFKPSPRIWIQTPDMGNTWVREPLATYANYSPELILAWLLGVPLLTIIIVVTLVRQLNRPLKRLQNAAIQFTETGRADYLDTNHGPLEIRQANHAFNQMIYNLQQTENDRKIMLAGISHDLRTPLTRIRLSAEMMPDEDFLKEGLIYDVDDMDAILNQFISYMRDGSDEEITDTDLNILLQELVIQFQPLNIEFHPEELPIIPIRSLSFKRMIGNLINNARRYGSEPIELSSRVDESAIVITIADHGEGIPEDQIEALVQPFVRGNMARTTQGSGLGLAIVKRIVDLHQGEMEIQNRETGGLEVIIRLPLPEDMTEKAENALLPLEKWKQHFTDRF